MKYPQLTKATQKKLKGMLKSETYETVLLKLLIECWNEPTPHFGGDGPHRYDGGSKECGYCGRPKNWKVVNPGFWASQILFGSDDESAKPKKGRAA